MTYQYLTMLIALDQADPIDEDVTVGLVRSVLPDFYTAWVDLFMDGLIWLESPEGTIHDVSVNSEAPMVEVARLDSYCVELTVAGYDFVENYEDYCLIPTQTCCDTNA